MKYWWWKILASLLVIGGTFMALKTPLRPATVHVNPSRLTAGEQLVTITTYGTDLTQSSSVHVHLDNEGQIIHALETEAVNGHTVKAIFNVPKGLENEQSDLVVQTAEEGTMWLPDAFWMDKTGQGIPISQTDVEPERIRKAGFFFPLRSILYETIRNLNFHVPMWFTMMMLQVISLVYSIKVLSKERIGDDQKAVQSVNVSLFFAAIGLVTGMIWARTTWGAWWTGDPKLNGAAITVLIYLAYLVLRGSVPDEKKRMRLSAIYNIFAFVLMLVFVMVLPRMTDSLHPGQGGNPGFDTYDLNDKMRMVFYPITIGFMLLGVWAFNLKHRLAKLEYTRDHENDQ